MKPQTQKTNPSTAMAAALAVANTEAKKEGRPELKGKTTTIPEHKELVLPVDHRKMIVLKLNFTTGEDGFVPSWVPQGLYLEPTRDLLSEDRTVAALVGEEKSWKTTEGRLREGRVDTADRKMTKSSRFVTLEGLWEQIEKQGYGLFGAKVYFKKITQHTKMVKGRPDLQQGVLEITFVHQSKRDDFWRVSKAAGVKGIGIRKDAPQFEALKRATRRAFGFVPCFSNSTPADNITINAQKPADLGPSVKRMALTLSNRGEHISFKFEELPQ